MEPISLGISLSAAAHHLLSKVDWEKAGSDYAKKGAETSGKALWHRLKPSDKDKAAKLAVALFIEQFLSELEDKTPLASAIPGYQDQLKKLTESAFYEISQWMQPEVEEVSLEPVRRLWGSLALDELPQGFDWDLVAKNFARSVRKSIKADNGLREGLMVALQEQIAESSAKSAQAAERMAGPLVGFDLVGYRNFLLNTCAGLQLSLLHPSTYAYDRQVSLWSVFVPQSARISASSTLAPSSLLMSLDVGNPSDEQNMTGHDGSPEPSGWAFDESDVLSILEIAERDRLLVVLGDPGSGKTSLLNYRALQWVNEGRGQLPLRVDLKQYIRQQIGIVDWLEKGCSSYRLDAVEIDRQLQAGDAALYLDGLDEIFDLPTRHTVLREIVALSSRYSRATIVVTSRVLGYEPDTLRNAGFSHSTLEELNGAQIREFLRLWHLVAENNAQERDRLRNRLQTAIRDSRPIQELAGNPLLLTMMAILNRTQPLPRNRVELYREASRVLVHEWDTRRLLPDDTLDPQDKMKLLRNLAGVMQSNAHGLAGNLISRDDLVTVFRHFLKELGVSNPHGDAKSLVVQLTERNFILCYAGSEYFSFVHRTFLEFFCASWFIHQFQVEQTLSFADLRDRLFGSHWKDETWHEVLCLIAGMVSEKYAEELLQFLMSKLDGTTVMQLNLRLAAQCLGEVRGRHKLDATDALLQRRLREEVLRYEAPYYVTEDEESETCGPIREHAVALLASVWRTEETRSWLMEIVASDRDRVVRQAAVREFARNWADDDRTHASLLKDLRNSKHWDVRKASIRELVRGWKDDPQTRVSLRHLVQSDQDWDVRQIAIEEIARGWPEEPQTLPLLLDSARNDHDWLVRQSALRELARGWNHDSQIQTLLIQIVHYDVNRTVRRAALQELARRWRHDSSTRSLLIDEISNGQYLETRTSSVRELVRGWGDEEDIHPMLIKLTSDGKWDVRQAALKELARRWTHEKSTHFVLIELLRNDKEWVIRATALQELARGWTDDPETHPLLLHSALHEDWFIRSAVLPSLAREWKDDPQTFPLLMDRAENDRVGDVRQVAIQQLARGWKDKEGVHWIISRASQNDPVRTVRQTAIRELARGWKGLSETEPILKDRARNDEDLAVRQAAIRELARGWKHDREVLTLLFDRANADVEGEVRLAALQELSRGWSVSDETHELLNQRVAKDESHLVRRTALRELARNWSADPNTKLLVRQLATSDPHWKVRQAAVQELARGWNDDPHTYSLLTERMLKDEQPELRQAAVREIARGWRQASDLRDVLLGATRSELDEAVTRTIGLELERLSLSTE